VPVSEALINVPRISEFESMLQDMRFLAQKQIERQIESCELSFLVGAR
jgi:hypothetical protein